MKSGYVRNLGVVIGLLAVSGFAEDKTIGKTVVDSGSFAIIANGKRVATETFRMEQSNGSNLVSSDLKSEEGATKAVQHAELEILGNGTLKKYLWKEVQPGKAQIVVEPQDEAFLVTHVSAGDSAPAKDTTHPLNAFTSIIDDNFFSQVQVLFWKYMAMGCKQNADGKSECTWIEQKMPILNPHQQQSLMVTLNYIGPQTMRLNGTSKQYRAFKFQNEAGEWMLWFNDENKLVRILISAENVEVLRD